MRALSIRQPYAELILRGIKTAELRSISTRIVGERFWIYASKGKIRNAECRMMNDEWTKAAGAALTQHSSLTTHYSLPWSRDLSLPDGSPPAWMIELAGQLKLIEPELLRGAILPTGVIVGSAVIDQVIPPDRADGDAGLFRWHLTDVKRIKTPRKPKGRPQPVWFMP